MQFKKQKQFVERKHAQQVSLASLGKGHLICNMNPGCLQTVSQRHSVKDCTETPQQKNGRAAQQPLPW